MASPLAAFPWEQIRAPHCAWIPIREIPAAYYTLRRAAVKWRNAPEGERPSRKERETEGEGRARFFLSAGKDLTNSPANFLPEESRFPDCRPAKQEAPLGPTHEGGYDAFTARSSLPVIVARPSRPCPFTGRMPVPRCVWHGHLGHAGARADMPAVGFCYGLPAHCPFTGRMPVPRRLWHGHLGHAGARADMPAVGFCYGLPAHCPFTGRMPVPRRVWHGHPGHVCGRGGDAPGTDCTGGFWPPSGASKLAKGKAAASPRVPWGRGCAGTLQSAARRNLVAMVWRPANPCRGMDRMATADDESASGGHRRSALPGGNPRDQLAAT